MTKVNKEQNRYFTTVEIELLMSDINAHLFLQQQWKNLSWRKEWVNEYCYISFSVVDGHYFGFLSFQDKIKPNTLFINL